MLVLAACLLWLARRAWRRLGLPPRRDAIAALVAMGIAGALRIPQAIHNEVLFDEFAYWKAGVHYVRNLLVTHDFSVRAWRWNLEHPPIAKWLLGFGDLYGGLEGARFVAAILSVASVGLVYALVRSFASQRAAVGSALVLALAPRVVGYARICALEDFVLAFTAGCLVAMAIFWRSSRPGRSAFADALPLALSVGLAVIGTNARATCIFVLAPAGLLWIDAVRRRGAPLSTLIVTAASVIVSTALVFASWRYLWEDPLERFGESTRHWGGFTPTEFFLGEAMTPPGPSYFSAALAATIPEGVTVAAALGVAISIAQRRFLVAAFFTSCAAAPLLHSFSHLRHDIDRYVVQSWIGVACLAGIGLAAMDAWARAHPRRHRRVAILIGVLPLALVVAHEATALARVEPYPLAYFADAIGGPAGVERDRSFGMTAWGDGVREAIEYVNEVAPYGSTVQLHHRLAQCAALRADLGEVPGGADYIVVHQINYAASEYRAPPGCRAVHRVAVEGATLARVYACR
jgi:hypothetical protein